MNGNEGEGKVRMSVDDFREGREAGVVTGSEFNPVNDNFRKLQE